MGKPGALMKRRADLIPLRVQYYGAHARIRVRPARRCQCYGLPHPPDHARINRQSRGRLYSAFRTLAFDSVRENSFGSD